MSIILDLILAAVIIAAFTAGCRKGFVKSVWKIAALVVTIVLVIALKQPVLDFLSGTQTADKINDRLSQSLQLPSGGGVNIAENLNLPELMQGYINDGINSAGAAAMSVNERAASSLTGLFMTIIVCIGLFIIIRLLLMAVFTLLNGVTKLPVIKGANKLVGGLLAVVNIVFIIFLALALVSLFAPADSELFEMINNTYAVKYFYNYNILLQLFMKL